MGQSYGRRMSQLANTGHPDDKKAAQSRLSDNSNSCSAPHSLMSPYITFNRKDVIDQSLDYAMTFVRAILNVKYGVQIENLHKFEMTQQMKDGKLLKPGYYRVMHNDKDIHIDQDIQIEVPQNECFRDGIDKPHITKFTVSDGNTKVFDERNYLKSDILKKYKEALDKKKNSSALSNIIKRDLQHLTAMEKEMKPKQQQRAWH